MRYSHQRELILREVLSRSDYPTAEQICTSLRAVCPRLSLGTVYRDLNTLVDIGKVRRVSIPGEADRFEGPQEDHQQLYCRSCQKVKSIHISDAKLKALIDACPDIVPEDYSLTVFGLCDNAPPKRPRKPRNCKKTACPMFTVQAGCFGICGGDFVQNSVCALFCAVNCGTLFIE